MKNLLSFALTFVFFTTNYAQADQCTHKSTDLPAIRGLKIGMSSSDILKLYPRAVVRKENDYGVQHIAATFADTNDKELKKNLTGLTIYLLDNKVARFSTLYDNTIEWASLNSFIEPISETLKIPIEFWQLKAERASVRCNDFTAEAEIGKFNALSIEINDYYKITSQRRKDAEEKKKKTFKP